METATRINAELSDLFFNHDNEAYKALPWESGEVTREDIEAAILADAQEFFKCYPDTCWYFYQGNADDFANDLAADFLNRL